MKCSATTLAANDSNQNKNHTSEKANDDLLERKYNKFLMVIDNHLPVNTLPYLASKRSISNYKAETPATPYRC